MHLVLGNCSDELTEKPDLFARLEHDKNVIHSELYTTATERNSSVVAFKYKGQFKFVLELLCTTYRASYPVQMHYVKIAVLVATEPFWQ